ncbi:hypothetical protein [Flavobacterium sp.]|uniref:hypothetical protein n=1 Tax=Flavobacterium sp. TaxID=239 RepID=UPI0026155D63|nr:hypothetical protein [Flavobacterium sp.]
MAHYKATSIDSRNFMLSTNDVSAGTLVYSNWYSFKANIILTNHSEYQLEPKGFWDSKIELKRNDKLLLEFKMGWKGIVIHTKFDGEEKSYLLRLKGLLSSQYVLVDTDEKEILAVTPDFKWRKMHLDYDIATSDEFDSQNHKELFLLAIVHCINHYLAVTSSTVA